MKLETNILEESEYGSWDRFVASCESGSIYSTASYLRILSECAGYKFRIVANRLDGKIVGGMGLYEKPTRWGTVLGPRTLLPYNECVLKNDESRYPSRRTSNLVSQTQCLAAFVENQRYASTTVRCRWPFMDARAFLKRGWRVFPTYTYIVQLSDLARQWNLVDGNLRRLIRRCESDGLEVTEDDDFDSFYRMHLETHHRKGAPIYFSNPVFKDLFFKLRNAGIGRLYQARLTNGKSIAAQLVLAANHGICESVSAGADSKHLNMGANPYLRWKVFERLAADSYTHNDLTGAALDSVARFKSQFGGDLRLCLAMAYPSTPAYRIGTGLGKVAHSIVQRSKPLSRSLSIRTA